MMRMLNRSITKLISILMTVLLMTVMLTSCSASDETVVISEYGTYGAEFARSLATTYPYRTPYSESERLASEMIQSEFNNLGFEPQVQPFMNAAGNVSNNVYVRIEGDGFMAEDDFGAYHEIRRTAVIGAHYDSSINSMGVPADRTYNGISDNASGIGCLMTVAKQISNYTRLGFDVIIVAFGAGNDNFAGASAFYNNLTEEERASIEVMYCIDSIYAGDKIYASSGYNSLISSQRYQMRRKLYQVYDVAYDSMLSSRYGFNLLYNESGILADLNGDGITDVYSEVTNHRSDYVVFDNANIPVVYFDSCDYFFDTIEEMKETKNLNLQEFGGTVRGTLLDSTDVLDPLYCLEDGDRLELRINNVAYCILESMMKGSDDGITHAEYEALPPESSDNEGGITVPSES